MDRVDHYLFSPPPVTHQAWLEVGDGHRVYHEVCGRDDGVPLVVLHGGPGGSIRPYYRQLANPERYRSVFFDQRGCGLSTPYGELQSNTTAHLVADMEQLRIHLGIDSWVVLGGSWGSALALAYAQAHPDRVRALIVTGVFLARQTDIDWWWHGARSLYPDVWKVLNDFLPQQERSQLRMAYLRRILNPDESVHGPAVRAMLRYETQTLDVFPTPARLEGLMESKQLLAQGRLHAYYDLNSYFLRDNQLLEDAYRLSEVPGAILNGRFDGITPPRGAFELAQAWPKARLEIVPMAGHAWNDPILGIALRHALEAFSAATPTAKSSDTGATHAV